MNKVKDRSAVVRGPAQLWGRTNTLRVARSRAPGVACSASHWRDNRTTSFRGSAQPWGRTNTLRVIAVIFLLFAFAATGNGQYLLDDPKFEGKIDVQENLGGHIPLDIPFVDAHGDTVSLGSVMFSADSLPAILILHYSDCPMLCGLVLNGMSAAANGMDLVPGEEYRIVSVSIDPLETPQRADGSEKRFNSELPEGSTPDAWRFLVGPQSSIDALTDSVGFVYFYDAKNKQYAHPAMITLITPQGRISRYLYGIQFNPRDVKLGLLEAGRGTIGDPVDKLLLYCFHYDPDSESYVVFAGNVMRVGGVVTLLLLALLLGILWWRDRVKQNQNKH